MRFHTSLLQWYLINKRDLPWRDSKDPYYIWLSEIIMQQTRIDQGLPYYLRFTETFHNIYDLAEAPIDKVLKLWQGLGYYSRARNLHACAKVICSEFNGVFPTSMKELNKLPGIGEYTASAIASICYNEKVPAIDGNLNRVVSRLFDIDQPIDKAAGKKIIHQYLIKAITKVEKAGDLNQALMDFGASVCTPKNPFCNECILSDQCLSLKNNTIEKRPVKSIKVKTRERYFTYLQLIYNDHTYIIKRENKDIWLGLYEFPLIEHEQKTTIEEVLASEAFKNIIGNAMVSKLHTTIMKPHILSHQKIISTFIRVHIDKEPKLNHALYVSFEAIEQYAFPKLIEQYINKSQD